MMTKQVSAEETETKPAFVKPELRELDVTLTEGGAAPDVAEVLGPLS